MSWKNKTESLTVGWLWRLVRLLLGISKIWILSLVMVTRSYGCCFIVGQAILLLFFAVNIGEFAKLNNNHYHKNFPSFVYFWGGLGKWITRIHALGRSGLKMSLTTHEWSITRKYKPFKDKEVINSSHHITSIPILILACHSFILFLLFTTILILVYWLSAINNYTYYTIPITYTINNSTTSTTTTTTTTITTVTE